MTTIDDLWDSEAEQELEQLAPVFAMPILRDIRKAQKLHMWTYGRGPRMLIVGRAERDALEDLCREYPEWAECLASDPPMIWGMLATWISVPSHLAVS